MKIAKPPKPSIPVIPSLRDRDEASLAVALCLAFRLPRSQGHALMKLATREFVRKSEISTTAGQNDPRIADSTVGVLICKLRKNLTPYNVEIVTLWGSGFAMPKGSREKVFEQLAMYDAGRIHTTPPVQPQPSV
jgi:hypothetical protein